jgi:hypothetical protein
MAMKRRKRRNPEKGPCNPEAILTGLPLVGRECPKGIGPGSCGSPEIIVRRYNKFSWSLRANEVLL